jgi:hypothetical protein
MDLLLVIILIHPHRYKELNNSRHYGGRDPRALKGFVAFLLYEKYSITPDHGLDVMVSLVSWIPCIRFCAFIMSIGETRSIFTVRSAHHIRYLIINFGNVANLDYNMW